MSSPEPPIISVASGHDAAGLSDTTLHLAYAEASVMLIECLMLTLMERRILSLDELVQAVETVIETKRNFVKDGSHPEIASVAAGVLSTIANSLAAAERVARTPRA